MIFERFLTVDITRSSAHKIISLMLMNLEYLSEWTFDGKRMSSNPKAQKRFQENKMTSFFGQVSRYRCWWTG